MHSPGHAALGKLVEVQRLSIHGIEARIIQLLGDRMCADTGQWCQDTRIFLVQCLPAERPYGSSAEQPLLTYPVGGMSVSVGALLVGRSAADAITRPCLVCCPGSRCGAESPLSTPEPMLPLFILHRHSPDQNKRKRRCRIKIMQILRHAAMLWPRSTFDPGLEF